MTELNRTEAGVRELVGVGKTPACWVSRNVLWLCRGKIVFFSSCSMIDVRMLITAVYGQSIYWKIIKQWKRIKLRITTNQFKIHKAAFRSHTDYVIINIYTIRVKGMTVIEMATHSSILAWRIPWTEEPGRLQSMGSHKELDTTEWLTLHFHVWKVICDGFWSPGDVHFFFTWVRST